MKIGILALQGDFEKHHRILNRLGLESELVRYPSQLDQVEGLIIPGGESTTMTNLMRRHAFRQQLITFAESYPLLGTCAGLILMADTIQDARVDALKLLNVSVERNAYGRQVHSFTDALTVKLGATVHSVPATFIRAPKIVSMADSVEILARFEGQPVAIKEGRHIGLAFHPELDNVDIFHDFVFNTEKKKLSPTELNRINVI